MAGRRDLTDAITFPVGGASGNYSVHCPLRLHPNQIYEHTCLVRNSSWVAGAGRKEGDRVEQGLFMSLPIGLMGDCCDNEECEDFACGNRVASTSRDRVILAKTSVAFGDLTVGCNKDPKTDKVWLPELTPRKQSVQPPWHMRVEDLPTVRDFLQGSPNQLALSNLQCVCKSVGGEHACRCAVYGRNQPSLALLSASFSP